ncbi:hypothetical protein D018_4245A, partial [Vibrio parahaemolyticus VP2007-007]
MVMLWLSARPIRTSAPL